MLFVITLVSFILAKTQLPPGHPTIAQMLTGMTTPPGHMSVNSLFATPPGHESIDSVLASGLSISAGHQALTDFMIDPVSAKAPVPKAAVATKAAVTTKAPAATSKAAVAAYLPAMAAPVAPQTTAALAVTNPASSNTDPYCDEVTDNDYTTVTPASFSTAAPAAISTSYSSSAPAFTSPVTNPIITGATAQFTSVPAYSGSNGKSLAAGLISALAVAIVMLC